MASTVWQPGHQLTGALPAVGEARFEEAQEDPLGPADVTRVVAADLAAPVVDRTEAPDAGLELVDAGVGERPRVRLVLDRGVLGGQPEAVEAHRRQHAVALHRAVADDQVAERVVADVAHVRRPARVRVHAEDVERRARVVVVDLDTRLSPTTRACHFSSTACAS